MQYYKFLIYLTLLILTNTRYMPANKQGFHCKDPSLSQIFTKDTVHPRVLLIGTFVGSFLLLVLIEVIVKGSIKQVNFRDVWTRYTDFATSAVLVLLLVDILKIVVGEPRPHFLTDCKPIENKNCVPGDYISTFTCENAEERGLKVRDLSKSFPSGHSALSVFTGLYFMTVLRFRLDDKQNRISKLILVLLLSMWSLVCSVSRITDNKHHWWDVLAGVTIGITIAKFKTKKIMELSTN